ncbi:MAG TPA: histidine kinase N-terminal 7TM domain-containing protein [Clostridia bacterium]|nr:histidine kinase N-terminal 7TM domain-containing protein [Clostridia bacterium]
MSEFIKIRLEFSILAISSIAYLAAIIVLLSRKNKPGFIKAYIAYTIVCLYWSVGEILVIVLFHINRSSMEIAILMKYAAAPLLGPLWLLFCLYYTNSKFIKNGLGVKKLVYIFLPPIPVVALSYTKKYHNTFAFLINGMVHYSWGFWLNMTIQSAFCILGAILIIKNDLRRSHQVKPSSIIIITGILLSLTLTILYYFFEIHLKLSNMDIVPSALVISLVFFCIGAIKYRFLNILPVALPKIIQNVNEGILVVDYEGSISFCNHALKAILKDICRVNPGMKAYEVSGLLSEYARCDEGGKKIIEAIGKGGFKGLKGEIELGNKQFQLYYQPLFQGTEHIGWVISFFDISEHKVLLGELNDKNKMLSDAYEKLLEHAKVVSELAVSRERNRIAMEIHDSQGHCLSLIIALLQVGKLTLESDTEVTKEKINNTLEVARNGLSELRNTVSSFMSVKLSGRCLLESIQSLAVGFEAAGINVDFTTRGELKENISEEICTAIYSICREALTNALKHGKASSIDLMLCMTDEMIDIYIFDNGEGCHLISKGNGLKGMERRISDLNGRVSFGSGGEKGFSIHAEIPMQPPRSEIK